MVAAGIVAGLAAASVAFVRLVAVSYSAAYDTREDDQ